MTKLSKSNQPSAGGNEYEDQVGTNGAGHVVDGALAEIIDQTSSATYYYHCEAIPGTATSAAAWRISRLTVASGVVQWADGNGKFDNVADNRTSLTYA